MPNEATEWLKKIPKWQKAVVGVVGFLAAVWAVIGWAQTAYDRFEKSEHHSQDVQKILQILAE